MKPMSAEWRADHALRDTKKGWEGPRWRLPSELKLNAPANNPVTSKEDQ